jgi:hypothetical protein
VLKELKGICAVNKILNYCLALALEKLREIGHKVKRFLIPAFLI